MIGNYLITVGTALITSSLLPGTNPFTAILGMAQGLQGAAMTASGGVVKGLGAVLKFARGGVLDGSTLFGLGGDYPGASQTGMKEIITPGTAYGRYISGRAPKGQLISSQRVQYRVARLYVRCRM